MPAHFLFTILAETEETMTFAHTLCIDRHIKACDDAFYHYDNNGDNKPKQPWMSPVLKSHVT